MSAEQSVKKNTIANLIGNLWTSLMLLAFVPFYIRLMGAESYGLVGVLISLQGVFVVLDLGLSQTLNREMSRLSIDPLNHSLMADTARTLEVIYWGIAIGATITMLFLVRQIAFHWLNPVNLSRQSVEEALWIVSVLIGLRFPLALYMGGMNGLQRQILANVLLASCATLQGVGALGVLYFVAPTIHAFFLWQAIIALLQALMMHYAFWHCLAAGEKGRVRKDVLLGVWRFTAGMTGIAFLSVILMQLDKILLSRMMTLAEFGYYSFAAAAASVLGKLVSPIFTAYYPRLTKLVAQNNQPELMTSYHKGSQLIAVGVIPLTFLIFFFSRELLGLWTSDLELVSQSYYLVSVLIIGNALNGIMHMPYALQLAHGWTRLALYQNLAAVGILTPALIYGISRWGAMGAAVVWLILNSAYLLITVQIMHRRLLKTEKWRWYFQSVAVPMAIAFVVTGFGRLLISRIGYSITELSMYLSIVLLLSIAGVKAASPSNLFS